MTWKSGSRAGRWIIEKILDHSNLETTAIYTHVSNYSLAKVKSPLDIFFDYK